MEHEERFPIADQWNLIDPERAAQMMTSRLEEMWGEILRCQADEWDKKKRLEHEYMSLEQRIVEMRSQIQPKESFLKRLWRWRRAS